MKKVLSMFLVLVMLLGTLASISMLPVFAATDDSEEPAINDFDHRTTLFDSPEEKLATMELVLERYGYQLYYDSVSGEVAYRNALTGQTLFTNPYDVADTYGSNNKKIADSVKNQLLSQLIVTYQVDGSTVTMNSYVDAALRGQITLSKIKNGIRLDYIIGQQETRSLVPRMISRERFESEIIANITDARAQKQVLNYYKLKDANEEGMSESSKQNMYKQYPITQTMAVYVFEESASAHEIDKIEQIIKLYCPSYTYEQLEYDHNLVEYVNTEADPPQFKMALEYTLTEDGLEVRLPSNSIRYNEASYTLVEITPLPYFGCGTCDATGYSFFPDGSGTIVRFEKLTNQRILSGKMYGYDYAYHTITGARNAATIRMPVYGIVQNLSYPKEVTHEVTVEGYYDAQNNWVEEKTELITETVDMEENVGFFAIVTEGDALASITSFNGGGATHPYSTVYTSFNPRPQDSYDLADAISGSDSSIYTVTSKRKYNGNYRILYTMLSDDSLAEYYGLTNRYECSYVGMAAVYRDYLERTGTVTRLTEEDVEDDLPLYVESFGDMTTQSTFLSFPISVQTALTTFEDLQTMYTQMEDKGITNVIYRLTGFTNGGMDPTVPNRITFDKVVGGESGYNQLMQFAQEKGIEVFLEFDMSYVHNTKWFDGFSYRTGAVNTIDGRYSGKREYSSSYQSLVSVGLIAISPAVFSDMFKDLNDDLQKAGATSISLSTLGSDLNSDFSEKHPLDREDAKKEVQLTLKKAGEALQSIMVDGGNAYTWAYVSHILNAPLDSSHYTYANETIPFFGMVLHGYIQLAGSPTNMVGSLNYEILKLIENGANPYFTLSYRNTSKLKESLTLSSYYSVSFENWIDDLGDIYKTVNDALSDVQTSLIVDHEFLEAVRVPTEAELARDKEAARLAEEAREAAEAAKKAEEERKKAHDALIAALNGTTVASSSGSTATSTASSGSTETPQANQYTVNDGSVVRVTYENGIVFILNYNTFDVTVDDITVPSYGFVKLS